MIWNTIIELRRHMLRAEPVECVAILASGREQPIIVDDSVPEGTEILIDLSPSGDTPASQYVRHIKQGLPIDETTPTIYQAHSAFDIEKLSPTANTSGSRVASGLVPEQDSDQQVDDYLAYALLPYFSKKQQRCFAISHFAQTLDGRIASTTGDSRWIGNQENLIHAHRMRALCDGILIGSNTSRLDKPSLNVRHVAGDDPVRIIMGQSTPGYVPNESYESKLIQLTPDLLESALNPRSNVPCSSTEDGGFDCPAVLDFLFRQQLHSVYIEGGSVTTSSFLAQGAIDQLQIHFAPLIIGSGKTGFQFSGIEEIQQALTFQRPKYLNVGGQIMFVGEPTIPDASTP